MSLLMDIRTELFHVIEALRAVTNIEIIVESGKEFADILRGANIATKTSVVYNNVMKKALSIKAYCSNKDESKLVNETIYHDFKFNIYVPMSM